MFFTASSLSFRSSPSMATRPRQSGSFKKTPSPAAAGGLSSLRRRSHSGSLERRQRTGSHERQSATVFSGRSRLRTPSPRGLYWHPWICQPLLITTIIGVCVCVCVVCRGTTVAVRSLCLCWKQEKTAEGKWRKTSVSAYCASLYSGHW